MTYCFNNLGDSARVVDAEYEPIDGEVLFDSWPTEEQLRIAFPGREQAQIAAEKLRLSTLARKERDRQLKEIYDVGTQMIRRELETSPIDPIFEAKLLNKRTELHSYARDLQGIPDQAGFPETITWPAIPTEELS